MYKKISNFIFSFGFIFVVISASFLAGILTGSSAVKPSGDENYRDKIERIFNDARDDIIAERKRLDNERENIARLRDGLERERNQREQERSLNRSDREDLQRLEYLIDDSIEKIRAGKESAVDNCASGGR